MKLDLVAGKDSAKCDNISKKKDTYTNLGPTDIFKHKECRDATFALFIIWMSINLSMHFEEKILILYYEISYGLDFVSNNQMLGVFSLRQVWLLWSI